MTSFRMLPLLRIGTSVVFGLLCLLSIAVWGTDDDARQSSII
jgi:hypothetical protein